MIKEKIKAELKEIRDKLANAERQANETNKKIELYNKRAKQIFVKIGNEYVSALSLIETFNDVEHGDNQNDP